MIHSSLTQLGNFVPVFETGKGTSIGSSEPTHVYKKDQPRGADNRVPARR